MTFYVYKLVLSSNKIYTPKTIKKMSDLRKLYWKNKKNENLSD